MEAEGRFTPELAEFKEAKCERLFVWGEEVQAWGAGSYRQSEEEAQMGRRAGQASLSSAFIKQPNQKLSSPGPSVPAWPVLRIQVKPGLFVWQ